MHYPATAMKPAKKFHIFHQRHGGKSADVKKRGSPAEDSMIATSHAEQHACVMCETIRQPINQALRQPNPEKASDNIRIVHDARNLIQTLRWQFSIGVEEPKDFPARDVRPRIHLRGTTPLALNEAIAETCSEVSGAIGASTIGDNDFGSRCPLTEMREKLAYQRRFIKHRNNDRNLHCERSLTGLIEFA
jgi:hypothetical protein